MKSECMDGQRIQNITAEGLIYLKDDGTEGFIDFAACRERTFAEFIEPSHLKEFQELNHLDDERLKQCIEEKRESKVIANRSTDGGYIEFYTEPPTRFEFATEEAFWEVRTALKRNRWWTFDLT